MQKKDEEPEDWIENLEIDEDLEEEC